MQTGLVMAGGTLAALGVVGAVRARSVARLNEQLDAIGSTTPAGAVEAADWKVLLTRVGGVLLAVVGLGLLVNGLSL